MMRKYLGIVQLLVVVAMVVALVGAAAPPAAAQESSPCPAGSIVFPAGTGNVVVTLDPIKAGVATETSVAFTAAAVMNPNADWVRMTFPERTVVPTTINKAYVSVSGPGVWGTPMLAYTCSRAPVVSGRTVTVYIPAAPNAGDEPLGIVNGANVTIVFAQESGLQSPWLGERPARGGRIPYQLGLEVSAPVNTCGQSAAYTVREWVSVSPTSGKADAPVTVAGGGFTPQSSVELVDVNVATLENDQPLLGTAGVGLTGTFTMNAHVNPAAPAGAQFVIAQDGNRYENPGAAGFSTSFTVLSTVTANPTSGVVDSQVTVKGTGFTPNAPATGCTVSFAGIDIASPALGQGRVIWRSRTATGADGVTPTGVFEVQFPIPAVRGAIGGIKIVRISDGWVAGEVNFTVGTPALSVSPTAAQSGAWVTVNGSGFPASGGGNADDMIYWTQTQADNPPGDGTVRNIATDAQGAFAQLVRVPRYYPDGQAWMHAQINTRSWVYDYPGSPFTTMVALKTAFAVTGRTVSCTPASGPRGTEVWVSGSSMTPGGTVAPGQLTFAGEPWNEGPIGIDTGGNFLTLQTVPATAPIGANAVEAVDSVGLVAAGTFAVVASIEEQLAGIGEYLAIVWDYAGGQWLFYDPNDVLGSDLHTLVEGTGYWVNVSAGCELVWGGHLWNLVAGWNLIGWIERGQDMSGGGLSQELPPALPCRFYGAVTADGYNVPDGTVIKAMIAGDVYQTTTPAEGYGPSTYALKIIPGNVTYGNETVTFMIGDRAAEQVGVWMPGSNVLLNLSAGTARAVAEISLLESRADDGVVTIPVRIAGMRDPETGDAMSGVAVGCYQASAAYDPAGMKVLDVRPGDTPFEAPVFNTKNQEGRTSFVEYTVAGGEPPITIVNLVPRLVGCALDSYDLEASFDLIADPDGLGILQQAPQHRTFMRGDIQGDGDVDIVDAMFGAQYLVGIRPIEQIRPLNMASVRHDGDGGDKMTIVDCMFIAQYRVGIRDCFFDLDSYRVGALFSVTGPNAALGMAEKQTVLMLVDQINDAGGIDGHPLRAIVYDTEGDSGKAVALAEKLIQQCEVSAIVGPTGTGESMAVIDTVQGAQVPLVSCGAGKQIVEPVEERYWVFKTAPSDGTAVHEVVEHLGALGLDNVALLTDASALGVNGRNELLVQLPAAGIAIAADEIFSGCDVAAQLAVIAATDAQAVICWASVQGTACVAQAMDGLGMTIPLIGSHAIATRQFIDLAGEAANGVVFPSGKLLIAEQLPDGDPQKAVLLKYRQGFESLYGAGTASSFGGHAYDALMGVVEAMKAAGPDRAAIRDFLENSINGLAGIGGVFDTSPSDHNGLSDGCMVMVKVVDGEWVLCGPEAYETDQEVMQLASSAFYSDRHAGFDSTSHSWQNSSVLPGHYLPTYWGDASSHYLVASSTASDPANAANLRLDGTGGSPASDAEVSQHAIWMGLLANAPGTHNGDSTDRGGVAPLQGEDGPYVQETPRSAMAGDSYNGVPAPGGSYCWVVGQNGQVFGAYKAADGHWYAGYRGVYP